MSLLLLSFVWEPCERADMEYRARLIRAITETDATLHERRILIRIAMIESAGYRPEIGDCRIVSPTQDYGPFQHHAPSEAMRGCICGSLLCAASVALDDVRSSRKACWQNAAEDSLAAYCAGKCDSARGRELSRVRWSH